MFGLERRRQRIAESQAAAAKSDRLRPAIEHLVAEAGAIGAWAAERYERNHLTELFHMGRGRS